MIELINQPRQMSAKKLIKDLLEKLKLTEDPNEIEDLEDQILRLAEQDEMIDNMTKLDPIPPTNSFVSALDDQTQNQETSVELEPEEKVRLERETQKHAKEEKYITESKLESKEEELLRTQMLNQALASNDEYAYRKERRSTGAKNKNKKKQHK